MLVTRKNIRQLFLRTRVRALSAVVVALLLALVPLLAGAQNRVDLDDMNIKGELLNDNRMRLSARDAHQISDRVSYRHNFRKEISDGLEMPWPEAPAAADNARAPAAVDVKGAQ